MKTSSVFSTNRMKLFGLWSLVVVAYLIVWIAQGRPESYSVIISAVICGLAAYAVLKYKKRCIACVSKYKIKPFYMFVIIGGVGAVFAETVFWAVEKLVGATGIAASPDLLVDLAVTMPWYIVMLALLWKVVTKHQYTLREIFIFGVLYEMAGDGIIGSLFSGDLIGGFLNSAFIIPMMAVIYSVIIIPPMLLVKGTMLVEKGSPKGRESVRYLYALVPWLGIVPYLLLYFTMLF